MRNALLAAIGVTLLGTTGAVLLFPKIASKNVGMPAPEQQKDPRPTAKAPFSTQDAPGSRVRLPKNGAIALGTRASAAKWAERMFKDCLSKDFGAVPLGTQLSHRFEITNIYPARMEITDLRVGCGCVTATVGERILQPGAGTTIDVTMDTRRFSGPRTESVRVSVGPDPVSTCVLNVSAVSQTNVVFNPDMINFGTVARGQASTETIDVEFNGTRDWKIEEVVVAKGLPLEVALGERVRRPGKVGYQIKVALKDDAPAGVIRDFLYLKTNQTDVPPVLVLVAATVQAPLRVTPGVVRLNTVTAGEPLTRPVVVRATKPFRVTAVEGLGDGVTLDDELGQAPATTQRVAFRCVFTTIGDFKREVKIKTDLPERPVTVTIQGTVAPASRDHPQPRQPLPQHGTGSRIPT